MIQSILLFSLGFLCAFFLALLAAPRLSRRAARLTRGRIEASVPLTRSEITAARDAVRADFATTVRRLEIILKAEKGKAAEWAVELARRQDAIEALTADRDAKSEDVGSLEKALAELRATLSEREGNLKSIRESLDEDRRTLEKQASEIVELGTLYEEASFSSSSRQIELVAREGEIEKLKEEVSSLRNRRREAERRAREAASGKKTLDETLRIERKRSVDLEAKLERIMTTLSDREDKLERLETEMARLGGSAAGDGRDASVLTEPLEPKEIARDEQIAELARMPDPSSEATSADVQTAIGRVSAERDRLEARLISLMRENRQLRKSLSAGGSESDGRMQRENAILRDQISDLAAEVVHLAAKLEGPDSDIARALSGAQGDAMDVKQDAASITSLADRVRALQEASAAGSS